MAGYIASIGGTTYRYGHYDCGQSTTCPRLEWPIKMKRLSQHWRHHVQIWPLWLWPQHYLPML